LAQIAADLGAEGVVSVASLRSIMILRDIACPSCDAVDPVQKVGIDEYRCTECSIQFGSEEVLPNDPQ
jgi:DNA-directed RNA polymerase subunit RPC12/RpoP